MKHDEPGCLEIILAVVFTILGIAAGLWLGDSIRHDRMLNAYCESENYPEYIKLDELYYCRDGAELQAIEWMNEAKQ